MEQIDKIEQLEIRESIENKKYKIFYVNREYSKQKYSKNIYQRQHKCS